MTINPVQDLPSLQAYTNSLGIGSPIHGRAKVLFEFGQEVSPGQIEDAFISESQDANGKRQFGNLFLFYANGFLEAESWINVTTLFVFPMRKPDFLEFHSKEGTWSAEGENPVLRIEGAWAPSFRIVMLASGENCKKLIEVHKKYLAPYQK